MSVKVDHNNKADTLLDELFDSVSHSEWEALANKSLRGVQNVQQLCSKTLDELPIQALYADRPATVAGIVAHKAKAIDNRLSLSFEQTSNTNALIMESLQLGINSIELKLDRSDAQAIAQLTQTLDGVLFNIAPVSLHAGENYVKATDEMKNHWSNLGLDPASVIGSINADPLSKLVATGNLITDLPEHLQQLGYCAKELASQFPAVSAVCVNTSVYHNAGASPVQELVSSMATATIYLDALLDAGLSVDEAVRTVSFQVALDADHLQNVVKLRALQQLWLHVSGLFGAKPTAINIVAETSQRYLSCREPWINHLRNISAASAALIGNAQSIIVHPHNRINNIRIDEHTEIADRVARNVPIILEQEAALYAVNDPMAGAYSIEANTQSLLDACWAALIELEDKGGLVAQLLSGEWQSHINRTQQKRVQLLKNEQCIAIGVNKFNHSPLPEKPILEAIQTAISSQQPTNQNTQAAMTVQPLIPQRDAASFETLEV